MKWKRILAASTVFSVLFLAQFSAHAENVFFDPPLLTHAGRSYGGLQDPEYVTYDSALRDYMAKRIHQRFGIELDPKKYSGFDFLEIESLFECKKPSEPFDLFLKAFPKHP